jgi:drug/metabolite transporter (DMT)-like permease
VTFTVAKFDQQSRAKATQNYLNALTSNPNQPKPAEINEPFYPLDHEVGKLCIFRAILGAVTICIYYTSIGLMPIQIFSVIERLNIFLVILIPPMYNRTQLDRNKLIACLVAFIGV